MTRRAVKHNRRPKRLRGVQRKPRAKRSPRTKRADAIPVRLLGSEVLAIEYRHAGTGQAMRHDFKVRAKRPNLYVHRDGSSLIVQPVKVGTYIED